MTKEEVIEKLLEEAAETEMPEFARIWVEKTVAALEEAVDGYDDRLAELEAVILDHYLKKGYKLEKDQVDGDVRWSFDVVVVSEYKSKMLKIGFRSTAGIEPSWFVDKATTKEMFDAAIAHFS